VTRNFCRKTGRELFERDNGEMELCMLSFQLLGASIESQELTGVEVGDAEVLEVVGVAGERRRRSGKD